MPEGSIGIVNCDFDEPLRPLCSVGVHPWRTVEVAAEPDFITRSMELTAGKGQDARVLAIGEAGMDRLRGADLSIQRRLFEGLVEISEQVGKPMIIHQVKCIDQLIDIRRRMRPRMRWVVHGFRGKGEQARQLLAWGVDLSFGPHYHPESLLQAWMAGRAWIETDDTHTDIAALYAAAADVLGTTTEELKTKILRQATELWSAFAQE